MIRAPLRDANAMRDVDDDARAMRGTPRTSLMTDVGARADGRRRVSFKDVGDAPKVTVVGAFRFEFFCVLSCVCVCVTRVLIDVCCANARRVDAAGAVTRGARGGGGGGGGWGKTSRDVCAAREPTGTIARETRHGAPSARSTVLDQGVHSGDYEAEE